MANPSPTRKEQKYDAVPHDTGFSHSAKQFFEWLRLRVLDNIRAIADLTARDLITILPTETPDGAITRFHFSTAPRLLFVDGDFQRPNGVDYTQSGTTVTFMAAPAGGTYVHGVYFGV